MAGPILAEKAFQYKETLAMLETQAINADITAGCRYFSFKEAYDHWRSTRGGTPLGDETMLILDFLKLAANYVERKEKEKAQAEKKKLSKAKKGFGKPAPVGKATVPISE